MAQGGPVAWDAEWREGKVKWFSESRAYGFLGTSDDGDLFFHVLALPEGLTSLTPGTRVEYQVGKDREGRPRAQQGRLV
jgi:cold shock protein